MKNKTKRVALYDPYLDTLGGGEKHILSILEVFAEREYEINIFWDKNLSKEIKDRFAFNFLNKVEWLPNIFKHGSTGNRILRLASLAQNDPRVTLRTFDYFFYVTDGSYFFSSAKNNFVFCMVPDKKLYNLNLLNRLKLWNYKFISNSPYTTKWLTKLDINPITIPPYIDDKLSTNNQNKKEKVILSVGRFFSHLHSKNQEEIIRAFQKLKKKSQKFSDYKLILAGGLKTEDQEYFNKLKTLAKNDPSIIFQINIPIDKLDKLYKLAAYFWHFTGLGVDENKNPESVEHFGIAPLEAMSSSCLTFCYSAGGPKELITDGKNGFLFSKADELIDKMIKVDANEILKQNVIDNGKQFVKENFSYEVFRSKVMELFKVRPYKDGPYKESPL